MIVADEEKQQTIRRSASQALLVYDLQTELPLGQILDMSARGMKIMTEIPITVYRMYYCRMPLEKKINGKREVFFDAECRWCRKNEETSWFNAGFKLRYPTNADAEIVRELVRSWMIDRVEKFNPHSAPVRRKGRLLHKIMAVNVW
nr:PilZ domain-containing protein [candidate division Zixibacteria bacterium]